MQAQRHDPHFLCTHGLARAVTFEPTDPLRERRERIDDLDEELARLIQERARISLEIGKLKNDSAAPTVFVPDREAQVLDRIRQARGPLSADALSSIYREILSTSRSLQRPVRVAFLGPAATFGHAAARLQFGASAELEPCDTHSDVFIAVEKGLADHGMVPVENSTEGPVTEVLDRLVDSPLQACGELPLPISHTLVSRAESLDAIQQVLAHPQAAGQARQWLSTHLPSAAVEPARSNGRAAELAAADATGTIAAIGPRIAAEVFGLNVLAENIQDRADNVTRFLVLAHGPSEQATGRDRTGVIFSIRDRVGALRDLADAFASQAVNLSSIQSRPAKVRAWQYVFFVELDGHVSEPRVQQALSRAEQHTVFLRVFGSWPAPT